MASPRDKLTYPCDALNRMASAAATSGSWGQSYNYDGFGNLTDQNVTAGSAPAYHVTPDPSTNHLGTVDANGNTLSPDGYTVAYDVENRMVGPGASGGFQYSYAPGNKRIWRGDFSNGSLNTDEITFWSVNGQKMGTYELTMVTGSSPSITFTPGVANYYFGAKLIGHFSNGFTAVSADRLGSIGHFYPYGQEKPSATTNGTEKFTGYFRDSETGFDYADQRYHNPGTGRFLTPDRYMATATSPSDPSNPGSWNRYAYVGGDPINYWDPTGQIEAAPGSGGPIDCPGWDPECVYLGGGGGGGGGGVVGGGICPAGEYFNAEDNSCEDAGSNGSDEGPDCAAIVAAVGFQGLNYTNALEIWNDGNLSSYGTDAMAATIAALAAVTWQGESSFALNPKNNENKNAKGQVTSVDYGPFQINQNFHPNPNGAVWGTSGGGQPFNGNPDANISFGITILESLYTQFGNNAAGRYVGSARNPNASKRQSTWNQWSTALTNLFTNTECFPHPNL